jgi:hypothetical protein
MKSIRKRTPTGKHIVVLVATEDEIARLIESVDERMATWAKSSLTAAEFLEPLEKLHTELIEARYGAISAA